MAAAKPKQTIETENIQITLLKLQSSAELETTPNSFIKAGLKILHAYTDPIHKWIAIEAGGILHLLKFFGATILSFNKNEKKTTRFGITHKNLPFLRN